MKTHTITWQGEALTVSIGRYHSPANISIVLHDERGTPYAKASVNPEFLLLEGHVAIKDYSENSGILAALVDAKIVEDTGELIPSGFVDLILCRLLIKE